MSNEQDFKRPFFEDVEAVFSEFVEYYGGKVIEKIKENLTDRLNADFMFEDPEVIAELKTLKKDVFSEPEDFPRLQELFTKWVERGMITAEEFRDYTFRGKPLPNSCIQDLVNRASKTIERALHKANKQIEESKNVFNKLSASGVVFLVNDGNYLFTNQGFLAVISNLIGRKFKDASFDVIIYTTINQATQKEGSELDYTFWIPIYTKVDENGETIVSKELHQFVNDFGLKFFDDFLTLKTGHKPKEYTQIDNLEDSIEEMKKHDFVSKKIIYKK